MFTHQCGARVSIVLKFNFLQPVSNAGGRVFFDPSTVEMAGGSVCCMISEIHLFLEQGPCLIITLTILRWEVSGFQRAFRGAAAHNSY
ncbi:hypothetical protein CU666_18200 [Pseudomonas syringae pv. actinidifoliorum]|nr:hypothetical protein [Pseudomonas syringae pv. actinidifoliorum]NAT59922.1 hypothetical protein [Pseudomonas syringae pv. actinidifoliorum]